MMLHHLMLGVVSLGPPKHLHINFSRVIYLQPKVETELLVLFAEAYRRIIL